MRNPIGSSPLKGGVGPGCAALGDIFTAPLSYTLAHFRQHLAVLGIAGALAFIAGASGAAADAGDAELSFTSLGVGVAGTQNSMPVPEQINHDAVTGETQALAVDLASDAAQVLVTVSNLVANELGRGGEQGAWQAFDSSGKEVASGDFNGGDAGFVSGVGVVAIAPGSPFRYLVFTALPYPNPFVPPEIPSDSSDYLVRSIEVTYADASEPVATFGNPAVDPDASADDWAGVGLSGFDHGTDFLAGGRFIGAPIVVNDAECSTGQGTNNQSCKMKFADEFEATVAGGDVEGIINIAGISTVVDVREDCGFSGTPPNRTLPGAIQPIAETADGGLDLGFALDLDVTGPIVPPHLCGIPQGPEEVPQFVLLNLDASVVVTRTVIEHEVDTHPDYECLTGSQVLALPAGARDAQRSRLPVIGWLPKTSNPEIPVLDGSGLVPVLQDVSTGCGSGRGGSGMLSFLVYDLHHKQGTIYRNVIRDEIAQLQFTVGETPACIDSAQAENLKSRVKLILDGYDKGRMSYAKKELIGLLTLVQSKRLDREFLQCGFDLEARMLTLVNPAVPDDADDSVLPRNFRGDLIVQIRHILYMMDRMLGVTSPTTP